MIYNKSKNAIRILNENKIQLGNIQNVQQGNTWKATLKASLILYLGPNSAIVGRLENLHFTKKVTTSGQGYIGSTTVNVYDDNNRENFKDLIDNSIQHIQSHGLFKNPSKNNFLSEFNNAQLMSGLVVVAGIVFSAGNYKGTLDNESQITEIKHQKSSFEKKYNEAVKANEKLSSKTDSIKTVK
jgi:hypothetical protein